MLELMYLDINFVSSFLNVSIHLKLFKEINDEGFVILKLHYVITPRIINVINMLNNLLMKVKF